MRGLLAQGSTRSAKTLPVKGTMLAMNVDNELVIASDSKERGNPCLF